MRGISVLIAVLLTAGACATRPAVDPEEARAALRDADSRYTQAAVGKDRVSLVGLYSDDAAMYPPAAAAATGHEGIGNLVDTFWSDPAFSGSFRPIAVEVSGDGTMGYTHNAADLTATGPDGNPTTERVRDVHVWRKQADGSWKIVIDIWNAEPSSSPTSSVDEVRAAIAEAWSGFESAWLTGDVPAATSGFFTVEAINVVPDAAESRGRAAIDADFTEFFKTAKVTSIDRSTEEVEVSGGLAYERGTFVQTVQPREGAAQTQHSRYLAIWERQPDGSWRCQRFLFNNAPRPV